MVYIKINKSSLDYHQYSDFHVFTMNNFVRNVMQKGKYKKAVKIVRLGLLKGLKDLHVALLNKDAKVARTFFNLKRTQYHPDTKTQMELNLINKNKKFESKTVIKRSLPAIQGLQPGVFEDSRLDYYKTLTTEISSNLKREIPAPTVSFYDFLNTQFEKEELDKEFPENFVAGKYIYEQNGDFINTDELPPEDKTNDQYALFESINFKKIYSKKPKKHYYGIRNLTVFDMVIQVYTMLTGVWYMRKAKVSGRTILIPSPLRPYRRITTVTKMLLKGIRKRRRLERFTKKAMVSAISQEFFWLLFYNGVQYTSYAAMIDNSYVWNAKTDSHKELVANLKNIKHLKYF